jgi:hypothetical protein
VGCLWMKRRSRIVRRSERGMFSDDDGGGGKQNRKGKGKVGGGGGEGPLRQEERKLEKWVLTFCQMI